jgi:hypothetical protein
MAQLLLSSGAGIVIFVVSWATSAKIAATMPVLARSSADGVPISKPA